MSANLILIWDYDSALGQINSTLPYNFGYGQIYKEIENVDYLLQTAKKNKLKMTFACLGFAAEPGTYPFNISEQIKQIFDEGHEIASHSWRHEWFPFLTELQIRKSLERSKSALEQCIGMKEVVKGFVPPHSRPMSWYKKFSISIGDRAFYPLNKGSDLGFILKQLSSLNYSWCRVLKSYKPVWMKLLNSTNHKDIIFKKWEIHNNIVCVPQHYTGFDATAKEYLEKAVKKNEALVIVGHPAALSRKGQEGMDHFDDFIETVNKYQSEGKIVTSTVSKYISAKFTAEVKRN